MINWKSRVTTAISGAIITLTAIYMLFWFVSFGPTPLDVFWLWLFSLPLALIIGSVTGILAQWLRNKTTLFFTAALAAIGMVIGMTMAVILSGSVTDKLVDPGERFAYNIVSGSIVAVSGVATVIFVLLLSILLHNLRIYFIKSRT